MNFVPFNSAYFRSGYRTMFAWTSAAIVSLTSAAHAEPYHKTTDAVGYKCIFNHELLIISHKKTNSAVNVQEANLP